MLNYIRRIIASMSLKTVLLISGVVALIGMVFLFSLYSEGNAASFGTSAFVLISICWLFVFLVAVAVVIFIDHRRRQNENRWRKFKYLFDQYPYSVMIIGLDGRIEYVNHVFLRQTGYSDQDMIGEIPSTFFSSELSHETYSTIWREISSGNSWTGVIDFKQKNGDTFHQRITINPIIDDRDRIIDYQVLGENDKSILHDRLIEVEKRSAVSLLAAGVAHEYKNLLCGIIGNASVILDDEKAAGDPAEVREVLSAIIAISERADNLTSKLLTYSQATIDTYELIDLRSIVENTLTLIWPELDKSTIEVFTQFDNIPEIECAPGRIQQMIMNLIINARQAIGNNGTINISLEADGDAVLLRVADSGSGIPEAMQSRVFDPFFSTKGVWGEKETNGLGLGLAVCQNITRDHGGEITVESDKNSGTVFTVNLPTKQKDKIYSSTPESDISLVDQISS